MKLQRLLLALSLGSLGGCMLDDGAIDDDNLGVVESDITAWTGNTVFGQDNLAPLDLGWPASSATCVLSQVTGDLTKGQNDGVGFLSSANIKVNSAGRYALDVHAGGHRNSGTGYFEWDHNLIGSAAVCVPYPRSATGSWTTRRQMYGLTPPTKLANLAPTRRCFLTGLIVGGGSMFSHWEDSVSVRQITAPDATHPTTGFYLEGTIWTANTSINYGTAYAACIDFPTIEGDFGAAFGGATNALTTGSGRKMCGLQGIFGTFNSTSASNGVIINQPFTASGHPDQTGNWSMFVTTDKFATAECIQ